jgi:GNAT superfamily N-acetyltransferase
MAHLSAIHIRAINPESDAEIDLVAQRMRATLIEVEGETVGTSLYSMEWLRDRVRWHLDGNGVVASVMLAENADGDIVGHTIVRRETCRTGEPFGLISTTYVVPGARRTGVAEALLRAGEQWFKREALQIGVTWTSSTNAKLIELYERHGYKQVETHVHQTTGTLMVKLEKPFLTGIES